MQCNFTLNHYREILKKTLSSGFLISNYKNAGKKGKRELILRHDIDYIPKRALEMAKLENKLGISSTYFVRVHGEYYHPFDRLNYQVFKDIIALGHEIGLHTEARVFAQESKEKIQDVLLREKKLLETVLNYKIISVAEHGDLGKPKDFWKKDIFRDVNLNKLKIKNIPGNFRDYKYISDSLWHWKNGCICLNIEKYDKIQALIHPDLWGENPKKEIKKLINNNLDISPNIKSKFLKQL